MKNLSRDCLACLLACVISLGSSAQDCALPATPPGDYDFDMASDYFGANPDAPTDYYKLAINWSPAVCAKVERDLALATDQQQKKKLQRDNQFQCFSDHQFGWVLHGLWGSSCAGKPLAQCTDLAEIKAHPRFCKGDLPLLAYAQIKPYLCISPGAALLQAEWEKHGACDFASATDYFSRAQQLFTELQLPARYMAADEMNMWMKQHNPTLAHKHLLFRETEIYICYNTQFEIINCPARE